MQRHLVAASLLALLTLGLASGPPGVTRADSAQTPPNVEPHSVAGIELENRFVASDATCPLPDVGRGLLIFTRRALTRDDLTSFRIQGLRYLGVAGQQVYAFQVVHALSETLSTELRNGELVAGTALSDRSDRLVAGDLEWVSAQLEIPTGESDFVDLHVCFWSNATASDVMRVLGNDHSGRRIPSDHDEPLRAAHSFLTTGNAARLLEIANDASVACVQRLLPKVTLNQTSVNVVRANLVKAAPDSLTGNGVTVAQWDGGAVDATHSNLNGRVANIDGGAISSHSTHVAGTIIGNGAGRPDATGFANLAILRAYNFNGDMFEERRESLFLTRHTHDNHSWGTDSSTFGGYNGNARDFDTDARDLLLLPLKAAGNEGSQSEVVVNGFGYDSLSGDSTILNGLVVGAVQDNKTFASFSSRGPTNDGRIKPDICANGVSVISTTPGDTFGSSQGTSMSTPAMTGALALLQQGYGQLFNGRRMLPDEARAIIIHTADDEFNLGPDYRYGWGIADIKKAWDLLNAEAADPGHRIVRGAVRNQESTSWKMQLPPGQPELRLTLTWLDTFNGGTASKRLVHDLDLEVLDPAGNRAFPWTLDVANPHDTAVRTKRNDLDNVEQVLVALPLAGEWTVTVRGVSVGDPQLPVQGFVLTSSHPVERRAERVVDGTVSQSGVSIPDNATSGVTRSLAISEVGFVRSVRIGVQVQHERRGDVEVQLRHPDGTTVTVEASDTSTRRDLYGIFPDTRSYDDDTLVFTGKPAQGIWSVIVADRRSGNTGSIQELFLEVELDNTINSNPVANAGADQVVDTGETVQLDASGSSDPDVTNVLSFVWTQVSGPSVTLVSPTTSIASFTAPDVSVATNFEFEVSVDDGAGGSATDLVSVLVVPLTQVGPAIATTSATSLSRGDEYTITGINLENADVTIGGVAQSVLSNTMTEIVLDLSNLTPLGDALPVVVTTTLGSAQATLNVVEPAPNDNSPPPALKGGGGGGCAMQGRSTPVAILLLLLAAALLAGINMRRSTRR